MLFILAGVPHDSHTWGIACDCIIRNKRAVKDNWKEETCYSFRCEGAGLIAVSSLNYYDYTFVWVNLSVNEEHPETYRKTFRV